MYHHELNKISQINNYTCLIFTEPPLLLTPIDPEHA